MTKEQKDAGLASVFKRDDDKSKRKELDARMRESAFVPDAYGECYPGYHELGTAVVDDDEADFSAMDSKVGSTASNASLLWQTHRTTSEAFSTRHAHATLVLSLQICPGFSDSCCCQSDKSCCVWWVDARCIMLHKAPGCCCCYGRYQYSGTGHPDTPGKAMAVQRQQPKVMQYLPDAPRNFFCLFSHMLEYSI